MKNSPSRIRNCRHFVVQDRQSPCRAWISSLCRSVALLSLLILAAGCEFIPHTRSWSEDVQLDDGSVVTIERYVRFKRYNAWAGDAPGVIETRSTLAFTGALASLPEWSFTLMPLVMYRDQKTQEWVVVARTRECEVWYAHGHPFPPYWEYRLNNGQWREVSLSAASLGRFTNLFIDYLDDSTERHIGVEVKRIPMMDPARSNPDRRIEPDIRRHCMVNAK